MRAANEETIFMRRSEPKRGAGRIPSRPATRLDDSSAVFPPFLFSRVRHALAGLAYGLQRGELVSHLVFGFLAVGLGALLCLRPLEWALVLGAIGLVLTSETMNSAIEALSDVLGKRREGRIGRVKDLAAGAVLLSSLTALLIGVSVFVPHLMGGTTTWPCLSE